MLWLWLLDKPEDPENTGRVFALQKEKKTKNPDMSPQTRDNGTCQQRLAAEDDSRVHSALNVRVIKWDKVLAADIFAAIAAAKRFVETL